MGDANSTLNVRTNVGRAAALLTALLAASVGQTQTSGPVVPDRFTATTVSMTPGDVQIRIAVREWSDDAARVAVVEELANASEAAKALADLPSIGHVWLNTSAVGYALKYAHRVSTPEGERVTFVTDKRLGAYEFKSWTAETPASPPDLGYSVIELYLGEDGSGVGTLSLAANIELDEANALVGLAAGEDAPRVLANAKREPQPYWLSER